jgi:hypothetical protein
MYLFPTSLPPICALRQNAMDLFLARCVKFGFIFSPPKDPRHDIHAGIAVALLRAR